MFEEPKDEVNWQCDWKIEVEAQILGVDELSYGS
jgi:hypothetical protein